VAAVIAGIQKHLSRPILLICGHLDEGDDLADDLELFNAGARPDVLPALELGGTLGRVSEEQVANRLRLISKLAETGSGKNRNPEPGTRTPVLVAPIQALMQSIPSRDDLKHLVRTVSVGDSFEPEKLIVWLAEHGYNRLDQVEVPGDFAVRGGIIDVYLPGEFDEDSEQVG
jgi:transcription-repair coupling factor (superfamily II helicase)